MAIYCLNVRLIMCFVPRKNVVDLQREGFRLGKVGQNTKGHETFYSFIDF